MRAAPWILIAAACSSPNRPAPTTTAVTPADPAPTPVATPAAVSTTAAPPAMQFADSAPVFGFRDASRRAKLAAAFPEIEKAVADEVKKQGIGGVAFGIVIDGELAYAKGFGATEPDGKTVPDADTVYRIGSISKSFTGMTLLALRDAGALQLDDPLAKWIPEAAGLVYPTRDAQPLTLRQLANHTSGLPRMGTFEPENGPAEAVVVKSLAKLPLEFTPGTHWQYSNLAFGLLGIAISHAAKAPFHDVVERTLWKPLGMTATAWDHADVPKAKLAPAFELGPKGLTPRPTPARLGAIDGAGGIYSSVRDMAKYVAFQLDAYPARNTEDRGSLRRATVREAHSTGVPSPSGPKRAASYGFGWGAERSCQYDDVVGHNGAIDSYRADVAFSPARGVGIIAMSNFPTANTRAFVEITLAALDKTGAFVPRTATPDPQASESMKRLLAVYHQWDEAGLKAALARPIDPREQTELATYKQLHGTCTTFEAARFDTPTAGTFALQCERGKLEMRIDLGGGGKINGFIGFSRGVTPPAHLAKAAQAFVALSAKWDDKLYAKHFAKAAPAAVAKQRAAQFRERHGDCKLGPAIHEGFDWGYEVMCKKENVEVYLVTNPADPTQITGFNLRPLRDEPKKCD